MVFPTGPFGNIDFFAPHGPSGPFQMAVNNHAFAMASQGFEVAKIVDAQDMGFTNGDATVTFAGADAGHVQHTLVDSEEMKAYRIISVVAGVSYELERIYEGTTGTKESHVIVGNASNSRVAAFNPQQFVLGGAPPA